jgi:curved DNA-binding protein CbpA
MTRDEALRLLGLGPEASENDIKLAYREMAQILHPDKFPDKKSLQQRATEQFKHINEAREVLLGSRQSSRKSGRQQARTGKSGAGQAGRGKAGTASDGSSSGGYAASGHGDEAAALKARLAGIAAARVQLTAQLDHQLDSRRTGFYLLFGGAVAGLGGLALGRFRDLLLALGSTAFIWGAFQVFSVQNNIRVLKKHLAELDRQQKICEKQLNEL